LRFLPSLLGSALLLTVSVADDYTVDELIRADHSIATKLGLEEDNAAVLKGVLDHFINVKKQPLEQLCTSQTNIYHYADYHPMHYACLLDRDEHIRLLVSVGCDKDLPAPTGVPPLHVAAEEGSAKSFKALLELGADPTQVAYEQIVRNNDAPHRGFDGMTVATLAASYDKIEVVKLLRDFGGAAAAMLTKRDLNGGMDPNGWSPLQYAAWKGHRSMYQWLIFEAGWGDSVTKAEVLKAATTTGAGATSKDVKLLKELAALDDEGLEARREEWLINLASIAGKEL